MLKKFIQIVGGDPDKREIEHYAEIAAEINDLESQFEAFSNQELRAKTDEFRNRILEATLDIDDEDDKLQVEQEILEELLPEAFAVVREASKRTLGQRHYDVQLIGGVVLHKGNIAEMRTGEGKTLVSTLPLYLNSISGKGAHLITVNDYLARRDARWMAPIYNLLGLSVGVLQMAARTESGKKAFVVDLESESPHEDQHQLQMVPRSQAYAADITYGTNSEYGFDYLRDNMTMQMEDRVQRGHHFAIIDEVDNVLIDEARTPLIISGPAQDEAEWYVRMAQVIRQLRPEDYEVSEKDRNVSLTEIGEVHIEDILGMALRDPERPEDITLEQARILGYIEQSMRAEHLFHRNKEYLVQGGKVVIVDDFTGRLMPGRRWSDGLHQAVEAKEGVRVNSESVTYATITIQNYFRMYKKLSGMTGTAVTEAEEFNEIYSLHTLAIPTNLEYLANLDGSELAQLDDRDDDGYRYTFYALEEDENRTPVFWKRKDYPDVVYRTEEAKLRAIANELLRDHSLGRPVLVGTTSVEMSDRLSSRLRAEPLRRLAQVTLLRDAWIREHDHIEDGRQIAELQFLMAPLDKLQTSQLRTLSRELGIPLNPASDENIKRLLILLDLPIDRQERLNSSLMGGIPAQVLNARKHTEESQIIAGAGSYGAVTIATNMAGRGVDIKLGGDLAEELLSTVSRVLRRSGYTDIFNMTLQERLDAIEAMDPSDYGIYDAEIKYFKKYMLEEELVRSLGGLHVIGSERHEARRIDNQLRGRSARQGDPGSSRFYLSMEDELMRLFGGQQADTLMQRLKIDDALPLEMGLVSRIVEGAQTRVEGANFDVRKHLLEYDDVLNTQRATIYSQRDRIFLKDDLTEDVTDMLRDEISRRVPVTLDDEADQWKLLAWLNQIQPALSTEEGIFPSFAMRLLLDHLLDHIPVDSSPAEITAAARREFITLTADALEAEKEHHLLALDLLLDSAEENLEGQIDDRLDSLDIFFEGLSLGSEEGESRSTPEIVSDLSNTLRTPLHLSQEASRELFEDPDIAEEEARDQVIEFVTLQTVKRLLGAVQRRVEEKLEIDASQLAQLEWDDIADQLTQKINDIFAERRQRYLGKEGQEDGQIVRDIDEAINKLERPWDDNAGLEQNLIRLLILIPQGTRTSFDRKTHRKIKLHTTRLTIIYYIAHLLEGYEPQVIAGEVLAHLEDAQIANRRSWGIAELSRLSVSPLADLDLDMQERLLPIVGEDFDRRLALLDAPADDRDEIIDELGRGALTAVYRQLMLGIISELWVEYITQMEALRVSIGLEAYGQRDPLVQYKNKAFELFKQLFNDMRQGVVNRMFTYRPRDLGSVQSTISRPSLPKSEIPDPSGNGNKKDKSGKSLNEVSESNQAPEKPKAKRRRRRKRK